MELQEVTTTPQAGEVIQPQAGNTQPPPTPQAGDNSAAPADAHDVKSLPTWAQMLIKERGGEAQNLRKRLTDIEKAQQAADEQRLREQNQWQKLAEQYKADLDRVSAEKAQADRAALMGRIALKHNLPADLAMRLVGDTEEALEADAERLAKLVAPPVAPNTETGRAGAVKPGPIDIDELKRRKAASMSGLYSG